MRFFLLFFCLFIINAGTYAHPKHEIRAVWLTTNFGLDWPSPVYKKDANQQKKELCEILDKLKAANFNVVFIQTRIRGNVIYPSGIEPYSSFVKTKMENSGYDPLAFAVEACHERGLECHAWFVTYPMGLVAKKSKNQKGKNQKNKSNNELVKTHQGENYLDPGNPKTNAYLLSLIKEIVRQYDIDGFHFDYIRYPDKAGFPDQDTYRKYGNGEELKTWRRQNINHFVYEAYDQIKKIKPWVQVSSSVLGMYQHVPETKQSHWTAYESVFQDPADWLLKGKHDFITPMMYYSDNLFFPFIQNWIQHCNGRFLVPGIGLYRMEKNEGDWDCKIIEEQIAFSRTSQVQGNVYFRTQQLIENKKGIYDKIASEFYVYPAQLPALTWLDSVPPIQAYKPDAVGKSNLLQLQWEKNKESVNEKICYNVYCSNTFPVDTNNPENLIAARIFSNQLSLTLQPDVEAGYYFVVTASDRFHNESPASLPVFYCTGNFEK